MKNPKSPADRPPDTWKLAGKGIELVAGILVFALVGYWVDRKIERISPWGLVTGSILGIIGGLYNLVRQSLMEGLGRSSEDSSEKTHGGSAVRQPESPSEESDDREQSETES